MELLRKWRTPRPIDLRASLGPLRFGGRDASVRFVSRSELWRATRTPDGAATSRVVATAGEIRVEAWGPGASWALDHAPALAGEHDDSSDFEPSEPMVRDLHRRFPGLRIGRTDAVVECLVPTILNQKVPGAQARAAWDGLVRRLGEPAPGPLGLRLPPTPERLAHPPPAVFHQCNVEQKRADTVRIAASVAPRLEEIVSLSLADARARLRAVPGVGAWTTEEVALIALGDPDAVSVGDYHLPHQVSWAFTGERRGDDERMLELLEPFRPHRGRVLRLLALGGVGPPRRGPRMPLTQIAEVRTARR